MQKLSCCFSAVLLFSTIANAADITLKNDSNKDLALSVYNNTALVRDVRSVKLPSGRSTVLFSGVASAIKPESVIINAEGILLREQNYNFAMMSPENVAKENIGKIVKTVIWDQDKGRNVYDKARILDVYAGRPVLQFGYGIEFDFPGRIIWNSLPDNLQTEPSLTLGVEAKEKKETTLDLMYLTEGLRWKANYVAEFLNDSELNLKAWISLNNTSGIDYQNARVQLVAGEANVVNEVMRARPMMLMKSAMGGADNSVSDASFPEEESVGEYHIYSLPETITLLDNQTKQVSLLAKDKIKYDKEYRLYSPLYFNLKNSSTEFKKINTDVYIKLSNIDNTNLGEPLPQGIIRFYDHDSKGSMLFMGESRFNQLAVGEDTELKISKSFDVTASGKVLNFTKIAENIAEAEVSISFMNAKTTKAIVAFEQGFNDDWSIISANIEGIKKNGRTMRWLVDVPAQGTALLNFKVRIMKENA